LDFICPVRVSHVHVLPSCCTQHHITPGICWFAIYRYLYQHGRFHLIRKFDRYQFVSRSLTDAAYSTVPPELRKARFLTVRQADFNLNGKLGCKALSSL
jgi:hypothetical protein